MRPTFLTARWVDLLMVNHAIDPAVLRPYVPRGTELDAWNGTTYVSLVAFSFLDTRLKGIPIPFHRDFEEINLRFYVRVRGPEGWRRGVVFVREVVPRRAIAYVARWIYGENYVRCPTRSEKGPGRVRYEWKHRGEWMQLAAAFAGPPAPTAEGSEEAFITEHYWGYATQRDGGTVEYRVEHPRWNVWSATSHVAEGDFAGFYGSEFAEALQARPTSVFVADGSDVIVRDGERLDR